MSQTAPKPRVLLADDDRVSAHMLAHMLRSWSYPVQVVYDGAEALRVLSHPDGPRLAILDWEMPGLGELDALARLRELPASSPRPRSSVGAHPARPPEAPPRLGR